MKKIYNLYNILGFIFFCFDIIRVHVKNAAVVQRLVPMLAMHMMTVRFRSVAPNEISKV